MGPWHHVSMLNIQGYFISYYGFLCMYLLWLSSYITVTKIEMTSRRTPSRSSAQYAVVSDDTRSISPLARRNLSSNETGIAVPSLLPFPKFPPGNGIGDSEETAAIADTPGKDRGVCVQDFKKGEWESVSGSH